jgi:hypothetical protein
LFRQRYFGLGLRHVRISSLTLHFVRCSFLSISTNSRADGSQQSDAEISRILVKFFIVLISLICVIEQSSLNAKQKVDVDEQKAIARSAGVSAMPTVLCKQCLNLFGSS